MKSKARSYKTGDTQELQRARKGRPRKLRFGTPREACSTGYCGTSDWGGWGELCEFYSLIQQPLVRSHAQSQSSSSSGKWSVLKGLRWHGLVSKALNL